MKSFFKFIGQQGVLGLAIGFVMGTSVSQVIESFVQDIINPVIGIFLGRADALSEAKFVVAGNEILWGHFLTVFLDFLLIALIIFFTVKWLKVTIKH